MDSGAAATGHAAAPADGTGPGPGIHGGAELLVLRYGTFDQQFIEVTFPSAPTEPRGMAALIHGGYWRAKFDRTLMAGIAQDLLSRGWAVANIEYRRVGNGGGWPRTADDAKAALETVRNYTGEHLKVRPVVAIGHSVGGQLAFLGADFVDAVVGLAPVSDITRTEREGLGENAAVEFMGATSAEIPCEYARASPIHQLPTGKPMLLVHGDIDARVPVQHSRDFHAAALKEGDDARIDVVAGLSHLDAIDPRAGHWHNVLRWIGGIQVA